MTFLLECGSADEISDVDREVGKRLGRDTFAPHEDTHESVALVPRLTVDFEPGGSQIHKPNLAHSRPSIERDLDAAVQAQGGVSNLDEQQDVSGLRVLRRIEVPARAEEHHIGLELAVEPRELDGVLDGHGCAIPEAGHPQAIEA